MHSLLGMYAMQPRALGCLCWPCDGATGLFRAAKYTTMRQWIAQVHTEAKEKGMAPLNSQP
jgi:hypothetical protein